MILMKPVSSPSRWLTLAHVFQVLIICIAVGLFFISIPFNYEQRSAVCEAEPCPPGQLTYKSEAALAQIGMTVDSLVKMTIGLDILLAAVFSACAIVIYIRKPDDPFTIFVTVMLVTFGTATFTGGIRGIAFAYPELTWLTKTIEMIGNVAILAFFFVFPNGRFIPRWMAVIFIGGFLLILPPYYFPDSPLNLQPNLVIFNLLFVFAILSGIASQIYRYIRVSNAIEKQQTKWVVYGLSANRQMSADA
jgi:hypothetical protein